MVVAGVELRWACGREIQARMGFDPSLPTRSLFHEHVQVRRRLYLRLHSALL